MRVESLHIGVRRGEDLDLQIGVVRETLNLTNKAAFCTGPAKNEIEEENMYRESQDNNHWPSTRKAEDGNHTSPTKITIDERNIDGQSQYKTHSPSTRKTEGINGQRKKTNDSNNPFGGKQDQNIGRHSDKLYDVSCNCSTVVTIEETVIYEKDQDKNKSTGNKEDMYEFVKKIMFNCGVIGVGLLVVVLFCVLFKQKTNTGYANKLDFPHYRREKRDTSTDKLKIVNPVMKIGAPLCISFQGQTTQCSVNIDNKTIRSDAHQYGSIRVYANGEFCKLCIYNFHLANHTIHRPIQVDSGLHRIATTSLQDIVEEGLVVYETVHKDKKVELIFSQIGQQAHCFYEDTYKINVTTGRIQLIYAHNQTVNITHTRILFDQCISFYVNCTVRTMRYFLDIPQCTPGRNLPLILGVSIPVLLLLLVIIIAVICCRRRKNNKKRPKMATQLRSPTMMH